MPNSGSKQAIAPSDDNPTGVYQDYSSGNAHVANTGLPSGTIHAQTITNTGTAQRITFDPPIKGAAISIVSNAATEDPDEHVLYCFDAPNTLVRDAWLDEVNTAPRHKVKKSDGVRPHYFGGASISYVDVIAKGTTPNIKVTVEGVA